MGVLGKGVPAPLFHKNKAGEKVRATKNNELGWRLRVRDPKKAGAQPERSFYGSYKQAVIALDKMEKALQKGEMLPLTKGPKTIGEAAEIWLEAYKWSGRISLTHTGKPNRPYSTWHKAKTQVHSYILPELDPKKRLTALSKKDLQGVLDALREKRFKQSSIQTTTSVMKSLFRDLAILEFTPSNYASDISGNWTNDLAKPTASLKIPTRLEIMQLTKAMEAKWPGYGDIVQVLAYTGLRWSELAALKWSDIDLRLKIIKVRRSATESGGRRTISNTLKSKSSRRNILLLGPAESALTRLNELRLKNQALHPKQDWDRVVNGARGGYISYKTWQRHLKEVTAELDTDLKAHDLRHTFASTLFSMDESLQLISEAMGHSSTRITEKTYIHLINRSRAKDAERINEKLLVRDF